jgi:hypothetical protein
MCFGLGKELVLHMYWFTFEGSMMSQFVLHSSRAQLRLDAGWKVRDSSERTAKCVHKRVKNESFVFVQEAPSLLKGARRFVRI